VVLVDQIQALLTLVAVAVERVLLEQTALPMEQAALAALEQQQILQELLLADHTLQDHTLLAAVEAVMEVMLEALEVLVVEVMVLH
jgi:hypothetical protein